MDAPQTLGHVKEHKVVNPWTIDPWRNQSEVVKHSKEHKHPR